MNTIKIESETSDTLTINYKGVLIEVDPDTDELLIDKKLYKIPALRRKWQPPVNIQPKLLAAPAPVIKAIAMPLPKPAKLVIEKEVQTFKKEPITTVFKNGFQVFVGNAKDVEKFLTKERKLREIELCTATGTKKYHPGNYGMQGEWSNHMHDVTILEKNVYKFETV